MVYPGDIEYCLDCNKKADEHDLKGRAHYIGQITNNNRVTPIFLFWVNT
jgi:hypothetical protein